MQSRLRRRRALGGNQFVDPRTEVLQHKVLLGRRLAVIDLLGPLLERQLDAECLVDRECDVEEIQAVDAEIVDRMAFRCDFGAIDVTGLGNDVGNGVESRGHRQLSEMLSVFASGAGSRTSPRTRSQLPSPSSSCGARIAKRSGEFNGGARRAGNRTNGRSFLRIRRLVLEVYRPFTCGVPRLALDNS